MAAARLQVISGESCEPFAASLIDTALTLNPRFVLTSEQHEAIETWAQACLHDGRRFGLLSADDLASLILLS